MYCIMYIVSSSINVFEPILKIFVTKTLCRNIVGAKCRGKDRKTWGKCVSEDMELLGLQPE